MKITVCDICEKKLDKWELSSTIGEQRFRVVVQQYRGTASTGNAYWKTVECCSACMIDLIRNVCVAVRDRSSDAPVTKCRDQKNPSKEDPLSIADMPRLQKLCDDAGMKPVTLPS